jgi:hypothetical protein
MGFAVAAIAILLAGCGGSKEGASPSPSLSATCTTTTTATKPPLARAALANLLLTPADVDTVLGLTGCESDKQIDALQPDDTGSTAQVYANSANAGIYGERDSASLPPGSNDLDLVQERRDEVADLRTRPDRAQQRRDRRRNV